MIKSKGFIYPNWPAPKHVVALSTTRHSGSSAGVYASANYALHVGDDAIVVADNRSTLLQQSGATNIAWLEQVHGNRVVAANPQITDTADAAVTSQLGLACAVMTADCLPLLLCDKAGVQVAAVHCGWRSLAKDIIANTVARFDCPAPDIIAWLGPAIGPYQFEVGAEVREQFSTLPWFAAEAFKPQASNKYRADIYQLARSALSHAGVGCVSGGDHCTASDSERFYSYRRDGQTGRMVSLIYLR